MNRKKLIVNPLNHIAKRFQPLTMAKANIVDIGGRASTKTSKNALCMILTMLYYRNCETIVIRQDDVHHRNSTMRELEIACGFMMTKIHKVLKLNVNKSLH